MRISKPFAVLLLLLLVATALPALCVANSARSLCAGADEMPTGSHRDHCPAPQPRACCQVDHATPMTVPVARLAVELAFVSAVISDHYDLIYAVGHVVTKNEFSPPPPTILRI